MLQRLKRKVADWVYRPPPTYSINMLLPTNTETAWDGLGAKTRNMIRKHEKLGHTIYTKLDGSKLTVEYDPTAPCRLCGRRVIEASMGGTNICPWCDSGKPRPKEA